MATVSASVRTLVRRLIGWSPMVVAALAVLIAATLVLKPASHATGLVGRAAPDFTLRDTAGASVRLSRLSGHPILLNFWGVTCEPCRLEVPVLQLAYERHRGTGLLVIGVDAQLDDAQAVTSFASEHGATYPMLLNPSQALLQSYDLSALPRSFLIDRSGVIRADEQAPFEDPGTLEVALRAIL